MAVSFLKGYSHNRFAHKNAKRENPGLGLSGFIPLLFYSILFFPAPASYAGPTGGNIVGGHGSINQSGLITSVNQHTNSLAIDWASFNVNQNEIVNFLQPGASSIVLNRILGDSASNIHGLINANGHVVLVNPNGIFFGATASVNVGSLIASGLDISPVDFMNGDYVFKSIDGTTGAVINGGVLNASLGGSITLLGKQVKNEGLISANLGTVTLAAGKEAVLTFDNEGLLGVKITREILQDELGVDPAILNSGDISAEGGRVLLTASQSQDVFSSAVNTGAIEQATNVVVHADGSFTLGGGADVLNTGSIDVSTIKNNQDAGQVVLLGENVTSSGAIKANAQKAKGGDIELHSVDTTLLTENSITSAGSENNGVGGEIKILGNNVGLFDQSVVDASGDDGGGQVFIGGDYQGANALIRNAQRTYVGENSRVYADALKHGDGGKVIVWADESTQYYGDIYSRGGVSGGNGGFAEVSGKLSLDFNGGVDLSAAVGDKGTVLLDPKNIRVTGSGLDLSELTDSTLLAFSVGGNISEINATSIKGLLADSDVELQANNDISVEEVISVPLTNKSSLTLRAGDDIQIKKNIDLGSGTLTLSAGDTGCDPDCNQGFEIVTKSGSTADVRLNANITTAGGNIVISGDNLDNLVILGAGNTNTSQISTGDGGGNINISGTVLSGNTVSQNSLELTAGSGNVTFKNGVGTVAGDNFLESFLIKSAENVTLKKAVRAGSGGINIKAKTVDLSGDLTTNDSGSSGDIKLDGNVLVNGNIAFTTGGGSVQITENLNAKTRYVDGISFNTGAGGIDIDGAIGNSAGLSAFQVVKAGDVKLGAMSAVGGINASQVTVDQANSFTTSGFTINTVRPGQAGGDVTINADASILTGLIDTSGGAATGDSAGKHAGNISLAGADITVGAITAVGSDARGAVNNAGGNGGDVNIVATDDGGSPSITLNGNIDTRGGNAINPVALPAVQGKNGDTGRKDIRLEGNGGANGDFTIGSDTAAFTKGLTVTSNTDGLDTITAANRNNTWNITAANVGNINANDGDDNTTLTFNNFENLVGGTGDDAFNLTTGTSSIASIDGGTGNNVLSGRPGNNSWNITGENSGNVTGVSSFSSIKTLKGNTGNDDFDFTGGAITGSITDPGGVDSVDSLTANDETNNWVLTSSTSGSVNDIAGFSNIVFSDIEKLIGGTGNDSIQLKSDFDYVGSFDGGGGAGTDTVIGASHDNIWAITGSDSGTIDNGLIGGFSAVEKLVGNAAVDTFDLHDSIVFAGSVDGGADFANIINGGNQANTWQVTGINSGTVTGLGAGFSNVQFLNGNASTDDFTLNGGTLSGSITGDDAGLNTLTANNQKNNWTITNTDTGTVTGIDGTFSGIGNLVGGTSDDTFVYAPAGTLTGFVDGGDGSDTIDATAKVSAIAVGIGSTTADINMNNVEFIKANTDILLTNTLLAADVSNAWQITGNNAGTIKYGTANSVTFTGFSNLTGGTKADTLLVALTGTENGGIFFDGGTGNDAITLSGGSAAYTGQYDKLASDEVIAYSQAGNSYEIKFTGVESVNDSVAASSFTVNGSTADDTIVLEAKTYEVNGATQITYSNKTDITVDGLAGSDNININGTANISGLLALMVENITQTGSSSITAGTLLLDGVDTAGTSGNRLMTQLDDLRLSDVTGDVFIINEQNQVSIAELSNVSGELDLINQTGDILDGADLVTSSRLHLDAQTGSIVLDNNNQLSGELFLAAANGDVTLNNTVSTVLGDVSAQNLTITSNGITDLVASQITVTNTTTLNGGGQDIVFDGSNHRFSDVTVSNTNNLTLANVTGLSISDVVVTGNADITAGGDVQLGSISSGNTAKLTTTAAIIDNNGVAVNVIANNVRLHGATGIGSGNAIETVTSALDVVNTTSGEVQLNNTGTVQLIALKNTGRSGNITIFNDQGYNINPGSIVANRNAGDLIMTTQSGSFLGLGHADISNPDITAHNATFFGREGTFGTFARPITLDVPGDVLIEARALFDPQFVPPGPSSISSFGLNFSGVLGALSALGGEQLVEVESLGEVDQAIFTDLKNFSMEQISIRLPRDQLFEDELEEYDRL